MFVNRLAYRHVNGEVEGFIGYGFSKHAARENAIMAAKKKVNAINQSYDQSRLIESIKGLTEKEFRIIQTDWTISNPL